MISNKFKSSRKLDTVLLKVASRCNLDCTYCYVYHMGDDSWRTQPKLMSQFVVDKTVDALKKQFHIQKTPFSVVLHGGEPLLLGAQRLEVLCKRIRTELPHSCSIHLQTNGLLLNDNIIDVLVRFGVGVSISMDGPAMVHDRFRKDHRKRGSFARVSAGIARLVGRNDSKHLFSGILSVIDPESDPAEVYATLKETGAPSLDFLARDGNWDRLPFGKISPDSVEYGEWLSQLLEIYLRDPAPPYVRILDDMLRLLLGGKSRKEGIGSTDYGIIVVEPDGRINKNDTLKVAYPAADAFEKTWSMVSDSLPEFLQSENFENYYRQQRPTSKICGACPDLAVCGGGMVAHRWSAEHGFDNPTVFCADQRHLIAKMRNLTTHWMANAI